MPYYDFFSHRKVSQFGRWSAVALARRLSRHVVRTTVAGTSVLEIGAGDGVLASLLMDRFSYGAYEPNAALALRLREMGCPSVKEQFVPPLVEKDASLSCLVSSHLLEHMRDSSAALAFVREVARVLAAGGHFILVCPDYLDSPRLFYNVDYSHGYVTSPNRVYQLLEDAGMTVVSAEFVYGSLPVFPGILCNWATKVLFAALSPIRSNGVFRLKGLGKLSYLFYRSMVIVARKP